ncbi:MAG TPA: hypothetical protein VI338_05670 [Nitrososphaera sp.]|nr:hypothetical protein [Nitrososphaera sp.]
MVRRIQFVISTLLPVLLTTNLLFVIMPLAHGQDNFETRILVGSPITVVTDKEAYQSGEHIIVTGMVENATDEPMLFRLYNPNGVLARTDLIRVNDNGTYEYEFPTGGRMMTYAGEYQILINYGGREMRTYFNFSEGTNDCWLSVEIAGHQFTIRCRVTNGSIRSISADIEKMMLIVNIQSSSNNGGSLMLELPKDLILSQDVTTGQDRPFTVFVNGLEAIAVEHEGGNDDRIIEIPFDTGQSRIEIVGTWIMPEFGPTVLLITLVSAAVFLVAISRLARLSL